MAQAKSQKPKQGREGAQAGAPAAGKASVLGWLKRLVPLGVAGVGILVYLALRSGSANDEELAGTADCPHGWKDCPRVPGVDWTGALALDLQLEPGAVETCGARELLSAEAVRGMHAVCVLDPVRAGGRATLAIFEHMVRQPAESPMPTAVMLVPDGALKMQHLLLALRHRLRMKAKGPRYQDPAIFTDGGVRVTSLQGLLKHRPGRFLLMEGGQWIWPPVEVGHVHELTGLVGEGVTTRIATVSLKPLVIEVENFLSEEEANHIIARSSPHMEKSPVALKDADRGKAAKEWRTSSQMFLPTANDPMLEAIDERVMLLTRIPVSHAEYIQVLKYQYMEHYSAHHDFFDPSAYAQNPEMLALVENGAKNRLATVFFYFSNVSRGGETNFPRAATASHPRGRPPPRDYFDCSKGISVYPRLGKIIIFYSLLPSGEMDHHSLHGACDVLGENDTKWSANFWLWNKPAGYMSQSRQRQVKQFEATWL